MLVLALFPLLATAAPVGKETARRAAATFLANNGVRSNTLTDLTETAGFAHLYIFNGDAGFVVMPTDDCVQPILGYSLTDKLDIENMPDNKKAWLQEYSDKIGEAIKTNLRLTPQMSQQWADLLVGCRNAGRASSVVEPLIQTRWNQSYPFNIYTPSGCPTGCVATAMAQVMKYWNYPEHGIGNHSYIPRDNPDYGEQFADFNATYYDWDSMSTIYGSNNTDNQKRAVATLMYHCGVSVEMNYAPSASGAATINVAEALKNYFNYSSDVRHLDRSNYADSAWIALLKAELDSGRPIQYHGSGSGGGHSFVCDGYNSDDYFHFNWGWGGYCDEYYTVNNLNPGPGGIGSGSNGIYNDGQGAVIGIHPSICAAEAPTNLIYSQNERQVTFEWEMASGAVSYNVYCNGSLLDNVMASNYTCTVPFGTSIFFVRSVDATGTLSLSSNAVTVLMDYQFPVVTDLAASIEGNNVCFNWTTPEWCYPETPSNMLTYGNATSSNSSVGYQGSDCMYWGHRYVAADLTDYNRMAVYKVSFFANESGAYQLFIYQGTDSNHPQTLVLQQSFSVGTTGWNDVDLTSPLQIDATQDLWVFIYDPEYRDYPAVYSSFENGEGSYLTNREPTTAVVLFSNIAFLIRTYLTDGTYTFNVYRDNECVASNVNDTTYYVSDLDPGSYAYVVRTNYYGGESNASNTVNVASMATGWNWFAPMVATTMTDLETAVGAANLEATLPSAFDDPIAPGAMVKVKTRQACAFVTEGPSSATVTIGPGLNWFGFTGSNGTPIADVFATPAEGDKIMAQDEGFAVFEDGTWKGTLTTLRRGLGYIYFSPSRVR